MTDLRVFTGNSNPSLVRDICTHLGVPQGRAKVAQFSDGEIDIAIDDNVRNQDVFVVQSLCAPTHHNLMEMLLLADALRRASVGRLTAVIPYFGYARQDRRVRSVRVPISARVVADMIGHVGFHRVLTLDLHAEQIQGFFSVPVDNVYATPVLVQDLSTKKWKDLVVVSPDIGGVVRARAIAKVLDVDLAIIDKRRPRANIAEVVNIIGEVSGKTCLLIDDIIDTAGTLAAAASALKNQGAREVVACCTHPVLSGKAAENIAGSMLDEVVVTDSIPLSDEIRACNKVRSLSIGTMLAEAMRRVTSEESLSAMFPY